MDRELLAAFRQEMAAARVAYAASDLERSFRRLERAHILGQRALTPHVITHWWMLKVGVRRSDAREIRGQLVRMIAAVFGYVFGWVPLGNTGGSDVSQLTPMPVPTEFAPYFDRYDIPRYQRRRLMVIMTVGIIFGAGAIARTNWAGADEQVDVSTAIDGQPRRLQDTKALKTSSSMSRDVQTA